MPFTLSHPLYAVPLRRLAPGLSATGLALGSMTPDMEYFVAMQPHHTTGHSIAGFFLMGLPLSFAFAYAFHRLILPALPSLLPPFGGLNRYVSSLRTREWTPGTVRAFSLFVLSLFIGFLSHLFMDAWTHGSGLFAELFPVIRKTWIAGLNGYFLLQQGFSVVGAITPLFYFLYKWRKWRRAEDGSAERSGPVRFRPLYLLLLVAAGSAILTGKLAIATNPLSRQIWYVAPFSAFLFGLFAASLVYRGRRSGQAAGAFCSLAVFPLLTALHKAAKFYLPFSIETLWYVYVLLFSAAVFFLSREFGSKQENTTLKFNCINY